MLAPQNGWTNANLLNTISLVGQLVPQFAPKHAPLTRAVESCWMRFNIVRMSGSDLRVIRESLNWIKIEWFINVYQVYPGGLPLKMTHSFRVSFQGLPFEPALQGTKFAGRTKVSTTITHISHARRGKAGQNLL